MKKLACFLLILTMLFSLTSCFEDTAEPTNTSQNEETKNQTTETESGSESESESETETQPSSGGNSSTPSSGNSGGNSDVTPNTPSQKVDFKACLKTLLETYQWNPESFIPEKLKPNYQGNLVNKNAIPTNYSSFVSTSSIPQTGVGEQWNMVLDNLSESEIFFQALTAIDSLSAISITTFNNYIDQNPADTAQYQFNNGIYSVTIHCTQTTIQYVLDYTLNVSGLGLQSIQIALSMNTSTLAKSVRIQIGDANALAYTIDNNKYTFALKYLGVRRSYFELKKDANNKITGHIYEYLTVGPVEIASVADFYIADGYLTVVGNKASGLVGFDGYICEGLPKKRVAK